MPQNYRLPQQDTNEWVHAYTGQKGVYSNYSLMATTQLLDGAPVNNHVPGEGRHPHGIHQTRAFLGLQNNSPMDVKKYSPHGQRVAYMRHINYHHHGVEGAHAFAGDYGHDGTRETTTSHWSNIPHRGVTSAITLLGGHAQRAYGEAAANFGPTQPWDFGAKSVGADPLDSSGTTLDAKLTQGASSNEYAFQKVNEHHGVPSSKAL